MKEKDIIDAYCEMRCTNSTIPDEVLDFMKQASIEKVRTIEKHELYLHMKTIVECKSSARRWVKESGNYHSWLYGMATLEEAYNYETIGRRNK